jgi:hypothetical protein
VAQPRLPPGVYRIGAARSAVTRSAQADAFVREIGPLATHLRAQGLSLRAIGQRLAQHARAV